GFGGGPRIKSGGRRQMLNRRRHPWARPPPRFASTTTAAARIFMRTDLFDFDLPPDRIALRPARPRDAARLLIVRPHGSPRFEDRAVFDLPDQLAPGDVLAVNDTRAICGGRHG